MSGEDQFIYLDVNINDETCVEKLKVFFTDDPKTIAEEFSQKYSIIIIF